MLRSAAGMVRTGSWASPEVTAITSMPLNDRIPTITASHTPPNPRGMKPPGSPVRLCRPTGWVQIPRMEDRPSTMKITMATTLMSANQYSIEPKLPTDLELKYSSTKAKASDHSHTGEPGNQNVMYTPAATASAPTAITCPSQ